jgi:hypothetical protein
MSEIRLLVLGFLLAASCLLNPLAAGRSQSELSPLGLALGAVITSGERRRVRLLPMAIELGISERKIRQLLLLGMPHTRVQGVIWCEPVKIHQWLDKFNRTGQAPGIKRTKGIRLAEGIKEAEAAGE